MIKIPGTFEGTPAIEQMLYEGININITLFSLMPTATSPSLPDGTERRVEGQADRGHPPVAPLPVVAPR